MGSLCTILFFSISLPCCALSASLISWLVMAPKSLPPCPARALIVTMTPSSFFAVSSAAAFSRAAWAFLAFSRSLKAFIMSGVASLASLRGSR